MEKVLAIIISHFFVRGKPQTRYRDKTTGRFVSGVMYRTAFGIKQMPVNHKYYGVTFYVWTREPLDAAEINNMYSVFCTNLANYLGYSSAEWWFSIFEQTNFEMNMEPRVIDTWRFKVDKRGVTLYVRDGHA